MDFGNLLSVLMLIAFFLGVVIYAKGLRRLEKTVDRMEAAMAVVAENLKEAKARADEADPDDSGAAADAALRTL